MKQPAEAHFDGDDYSPVRDDARLRGQQLRIWAFMRNGSWQSLFDIAAATGDPEASISAQLRHLRKPRFGAFKVLKQRHAGGYYLYRVIQPEAAGA